MKKFVGQLTAGDTINVCIKGSRIKSACNITKIEFFDKDEEFEHAVMHLTDGLISTVQTWYTTETVEVILL